MNHLKWMGHAATVFEIQKNLRNDSQSCEVTLVAANGSVKAHRFVLSSCSDLLRSLLADVPKDQEATIVVPDIRGSLLDSVLAFIYMGETNITSTNLSEFLEAINILGIKSAISFECNTAALSSASSTSTTNATVASSACATNAIPPVKTLSSIRIVHDELMESDNMAAQKLETQDSIVEQQSTSTRDLEFLDVYNEPQPKITYSIEHMPGTSNANEFILTENAGTFTLTQNSKIDGATDSADADKIDEVEEETDEAHIIEEYSNGADPIIEIAENVHNASAPPSGHAIIQVKSKMKTVKLKMEANKGEEPLQETIDATIDETGDPISVLKTSSNSFSSYNDVHGSGENHLDMAVQAVIVEGISLQKAAQKFEVSKTVLWRRVRKHPNYMKTARENPLLTLAYDRLKSGDSLKNISRELDIPMSTLHRHKVRLAQQGRLPDYVTFKKRDSVSKDELKEKLGKAVHACVHEGMSQNHAANLFDIPKSTLWRHLQKRVAEAELSQNMETDEIKEEVILS